jgi:chemotaxis protein MotA
MDTVKSKLPFGAAIAAGGGLALMLLGAFLEGAPITGFFNIPALLIVGGGTIGATMAAFGLETFITVGKGFMVAQKAASPDWEKAAKNLVSAADFARREGMLRLEKEAQSATDPFLALCYQLLADGADPSVMREILWAEAESEHHTIKTYAEIFGKAGGFSPTMGIIGTVMGLTHALQLLDQMDKLGEAIAGAFMATLYGVAAANLFFLPTGNRLAELGKEQESYREFQIAAIMSIQRGDNPRQVAEKLAAMAPIPLDADELRGKTSSPAGGS